MDQWTEIRSAYYVAKFGTLSGASSELGLHRATLMRHIDTLEERLSVKLFQRHPSGYTPTEFGQNLFDAAEAAEASFSDFENRMTRQLESPLGNLIVTTTNMLLSTVIPVIRQYQIAYPDVRVEHKVTESIARLEVGEAHIALRTGPYELMDDTVMLPFASVRTGLYAHKRYIERYGMPTSIEDLRNHRFVSRVLGEERFPPFVWLRKHIDESNVVFMSNDMNAKFTATLEGVGIGFMPIAKASVWEDMVQVFPHNPAWDVNFWLVTHVDVHRTPKVQALISTFREHGFLQNSDEFADLLPARSAF